MSCLAIVETKSVLKGFYNLIIGKLSKGHNMNFITYAYKCARPINYCKLY